MMKRVLPHVPAKLTDAERKIRSFEEAANLAAELVDENLTFEGFAYPLVAIYEYR